MKKWILAAGVGGLGLVGGTEVSRVGEVQTQGERRAVLDRLSPTVRTVPAADFTLLWKAADGFMEKAFRPTNLDLRDSNRRVIETHTLEFRDEANLPRRTRVTVEIRNAPGQAADGELGVIAQSLVPDLTTLEGAELPQQWILAGQEPEVEALVAEQIVRRYLLLRQGKDPETEPAGPLPSFFRSRS